MATIALVLTGAWGCGADKGTGKDRAFRVFCCRVRFSKSLVIRIPYMYKNEKQPVW